MRPTSLQLALPLLFSQRKQKRIVTAVTLLDHAQLDAMAAGQPGLLLPIVHDFASHGRDQLVTLESTLADNRIEESRGILHQLKGSAGTMGMAQFADICRKCEEQLANNQPPTHLPELIPLLQESIDHAIAHLEGPR